MGIGLKKTLLVITLLLTASMNLIGCSPTQKVIRKDNIVVASPISYWGYTDECIDFLKRADAAHEWWLVQSLP